MTNTKIALVTGANQGIGLATVELLLEEGVTVVLTSRDEKKGLEAKEKFKKYENCFFHQLDITNKSSIKNLSEYINEKFGKLDILINNVAINYDTWHNVANVNLDEIEETIDTNLMGAWRVTQSLIPLLKKADLSTIVNVSSGGGSLASQTGSTPGYSVTKLALNALTMQFANELRSENILVNSVCPGWVRTSMGGMGAPKSARQGAETIVWAALLEDKNLTGKFFRDKQIINW